MKTRIPNNRKERGAIILPCVVVCGILGFTLASYLQLVQTQNLSVARSQLWNAAIPVCEAGIEEALAHINNSAIGTNFALNGWTKDGDYFRMERALGEHRYVTLISTDALPKITASAYISDPRMGVDATRVVRVNTTRWATGMKGIIAKENVNMTSLCEVDSFDSEDERYSTLGKYEAAKRKDNGFAGAVFGSVSGATIYGSVATGPEGTATGTVGDFNWVSSQTGIQPGKYANDLNIAFPIVQPPFTGGAFHPLGDTVTLTNLHYTSTMVTTTNMPLTAPASGITTNYAGTIVTTNYPSGISSSLITIHTTPVRSRTEPAAGTYQNLDQKGAWYYYDEISSYSYPSLTYSYSMTVTNSSTTTEYYEYALSHERYQMNSLAMSGNERLIVTGTNVTLYIKGDFSMTGNSQIIIAPGASLKLFVEKNTSLAGNGIANYTNDASKFMYYGLPSNTRIDIQGNASFTGCIYAPQAEMNLGGGGTDIYDVVGATVTRVANLNGHFRFHYDERLGRSKILSRYTVASWLEI